MTPEHWQQIDKLMDAALALEASQRPAFLDQACAGDEELRREVEKLLAAHQQAGSFLGSPAVQVAAKGIAQDLKPYLMGQQLGAYKILSLLGAGGMGEVYLAGDSRLDRQVAIKVLPEAFTGDPERLARFEREAKLLAALNHPNIAAIHGLEEADGKHFLVLELVEGETLSELIAVGTDPRVRPRGGGRGGHWCQLK
jgi:serine/threonine protein kinase